jgi:hypothetical protein
MKLHTKIYLIILGIESLAIIIFYAMPENIICPKIAEGTVTSFPCYNLYTVLFNLSANLFMATLAVYVLHSLVLNILSRRKT